MSQISAQLVTILLNLKKKELCAGLIDFPKNRNNYQLHKKKIKINQVRDNVLQGFKLEFMYKMIHRLKMQSFWRQDCSSFIISASRDEV